MRAWLRDAWTTKRRDLVRVVLGSLGSKQGLPQLWTRGAKHVRIRRPSDRWRELVMWHMAFGHLPAGEGKRLLDAEDRGLTEEPDFDVWLAAVASESPELARRIDEATVCATWHAFDGLLQLICSDEKAWELLADIPAQKLMRRAARLLDQDAEVHITWVRH